MDKSKIWIKRLKCKHNYKEISQCKIDFGMRKMITFECEYCGKKKNKII